MSRSLSKTSQMSRHVAEEDRGHHRTVSLPAAGQPLLKGREALVELVEFRVDACGLRPSDADDSIAGCLQLAIEVDDVGGTHESPQHA